ncbi:MAG: ATP-binding cassette domain-containing protein, partial [Chitinivibrionales bacterium]|nr:ATP-binding cassette domain-containing protein [Chitinivibrionales bacterium]
LLRMIAGLEEITEGDLLIDGVRKNDIAPKDRDCAMVFQNYALYPHMNVFENMSFGLKIRKFSKDEIQQRVQEAARILNITELLHKKPRQLSGGERQRVAVGRAIVRKPKVFLFDEPLSNLDAKLRVQMRTEISSLHTRLAATMIYVTHDQIEAMTMGDRIVLLKAGTIQQIGSPLELYNKPQNRFVAGFIGSPQMNILNATVTQEQNLILTDEENCTLIVPDEHRLRLKPYTNKPISIGIRPENCRLCSTADGSGAIAGTVELIERLGADCHVYVRSQTQQLIARVNTELHSRLGNDIFLKPDTSKLHYFDSQSAVAIP